MSELEISRHTTVDWANFFREVTYDGLVAHKVQIGQWVFGDFESGTNKCFLVPVEKRDKITLLEIIKEWILPGTTIISDCW